MLPETTCKSDLVGLSKPRHKSAMSTAVSLSLAKLNGQDMNKSYDTNVTSHIESYVICVIIIYCAHVQNLIRFSGETARDARQSGSHVNAHGTRHTQSTMTTLTQVTKVIKVIPTKQMCKSCQAELTEPGNTQRR